MYCGRGGPKITMHSCYSNNELFDPKAISHYYLASLKLKCFDNNIVKRPFVTFPNNNIQDDTQKKLYQNIGSYDRSLTLINTKFRHSKAR